MDRKSRTFHNIQGHQRKISNPNINCVSVITGGVTKLVRAKFQGTAMAFQCHPSSPYMKMLIHLCDSVHVTAKCCADCGREASLVAFKITLNKSRRLVVWSPRVTLHNAWRCSLRHALSATLLQSLRCYTNGNAGGNKLDVWRQKMFIMIRR